MKASANMVNVFFTVDTEIWCGSWRDIDGRFADAFNRYIYGPTPQGNYALPMTFRILNDHGLKGSFFVEPLFSARFGQSALQEIVGMIHEAGHETQLHLHAEWADEARPPVLPDLKEKLANLRLCDAARQDRLIETGLRMLREAGARSVNSFRAGGFAANAATLDAVAKNGLMIDTSYNLAAPIGVADMSPERPLYQPARLGSLYEYPVTVFRDFGPHNVRPLQLTACSFSEFEFVLTSAAEQNWNSVVIVSHNFELLNQRKNRVNRIVLHRFYRLCRFLERHRDLFRVHGFADIQPTDVAKQPPLLESSLVRTGFRYAEQLISRLAR